MYFTPLQTERTNEALMCIFYRLLQGSQFFLGSAQMLSRVQLFVTPWTVACQATLSMGFSRQEYRSALPFLFPEDVPKPKTESRSPALQTDSLQSESSGKLHCVIKNLTIPSKLPDIIVSFSPLSSFFFLIHFLLTKK